MPKIKTKSGKVIHLPYKKGKAKKDKMMMAEKKMKKMMGRSDY